MQLSPNTQAQWDTFKSLEDKKDKIIERYKHFARKNSVAFDWETLDGFGHRGKLEWAAVDSGVRSKLLKLVLRKFDQIELADRRRFKYVRSVVVSSREWFVDFASAHEFDIMSIKNEIESRFAGINFVGAIEPGYYPRWHEIGVPIKKKVNWHAHLVVWTDDLFAFNRAIDGHSEKHTGVLYGVPSAKPLRRSWKSAPQWIAYAFKTPAKSYTTRRIQESISRSTGVIFPEHDYQKPQDLRPGEHVMLRNVMRGFVIDDLMVCGGHGARLFETAYSEMARDRDQAHMRFRRPGDRSPEWTR